MGLHHHAAAPSVPHTSRASMPGVGPQAEAKPSENPQFPSHEVVEGFSMCGLMPESTQPSYYVAVASFSPSSHNMLANSILYAGWASHLWRGRWRTTPTQMPRKYRENRGPQRPVLLLSGSRRRTRNKCSRPHGSCLNTR